MSDRYIFHFHRGNSGQRVRVMPCRKRASFLFRCNVLCFMLRWILLGSACQCILHRLSRRLRFKCRWSQHILDLRRLFPRVFFSCQQLRVHSVSARILLDGTIVFEVHELPEWNLDTDASLNIKCTMPPVGAAPGGSNDASGCATELHIFCDRYGAEFWKRRIHDRVLRICYEPVHSL